MFEEISCKVGVGSERLWELLRDYFRERKGGKGEREKERLHKVYLKKE